MSITTICERVWLKVLWQSGAIIFVAAILGFSFNHFRPGRLPLVADWSPEAQLELDSGESLIIPLEEAETLFFAQVAVFLDARSQVTFSEGHIQGAYNLPWDEFDDHFAAVMADIPRETPIVTYCDGESCGLSQELTMALLGKGYMNVRVLVNGWTLWQEKNLPIEEGGAGEPN